MSKAQDSRGRLRLLILLAIIAKASALGNPCAPNPCRNRGICEIKSYDGKSYCCHCAPGWIGSNCEQPKHPCIPNPCVHGGCCAIKSNTDYRCDCNVGWTGRNCSIPDNLCGSNPCGNRGQCYRFKNSDGYICKCLPGYFGKQCEKECSPHCTVGCTSTGPGRCDGECDYGYGLGDNLECVECSPHCIGGCQTAGGGKCDGPCAKGYENYHGVCVKDLCSSRPCRNGGTCVSMDETEYSCTCKPGFTGRKCEDAIEDLCSSRPCRNGGTCVSVDETEYSCTCSPGFTGRKCEHVIKDLCSSRPCRNGGTCVSVDEDEYSCTCKPGFTGRKCEHVIKDLCSSRPCRNGGTCVSVDETEYSCTCSPGFTGRKCEHVIIIIDPCFSAPCLNGGTCLRNESDYTCVCPELYFGRNCETMIIRLVDRNSTSNNSMAGRLEVYHDGAWGTVCDDLFTNTGARVVCAQLGFGQRGRFIGNFYGPGSGIIWLDNVQCNGTEPSIVECPNGGWNVHNCVHAEDVSIDCVDPCDPSPCQNGGTCLALIPRNFSCLCGANFTGQNCEAVT